MAEKLPTGIRRHGAGLQIRVQHDGKTYTQTIETDNPGTKTAIANAVRQRKELLKKLTLGLPLQEEEETRDALFSKVAQDYLNTLDLKLSTVEGYTNLLNQHWLPAFGEKPVSTIKPSDVKGYLAKMQVTGKTKKNVMGPLRGVFDYAIAEGYLTTNPCGSIKLARHQKPKIDRFTPIEKAAILAELRRRYDTLPDGASDYERELRFAVWTYIVLFFETGMRPGEILGLRWTDYDGDTIHVCRAIVRRRLTTTKTYEVRDVIVSDALRRALDEYGPVTRPYKGHLFLNQLKQPHRDTDRFNPEWREALEAAGVPYRIPYTCRHTRASELLTAGIEPAFAAKQMGHTIEMFFRTYADWIDQVRGEQQRAMIRGIGAEPRENNKLDSGWTENAENGVSD